MAHPRPTKKQTLSHRAIIVRDQEQHTRGVICQAKRISLFRVTFYFPRTSYKSSTYNNDCRQLICVCEKGGCSCTWVQRARTWRNGDTDYFPGDVLEAPCVCPRFGRLVPSLVGVAGTVAAAVCENLPCCVKLNTLFVLLLSIYTVVREVLLLIQYSRTENNKTYYYLLIETQQQQRAREG